MAGNKLKRQKSGTKCFDEVTNDSDCNGGILFSRTATRISRLYVILITLSFLPFDL